MFDRFFGKKEVIPTQEQKEAYFNFFKPTTRYFIERQNGNPELKNFEAAAIKYSENESALGIQPHSPADFYFTLKKSPDLKSNVDNQNTLEFYDRMATAQVNDHILENQNERVLKFSKQ